MRNRSPQPAYNFGPFRYDPQSRILFRPGPTVPLEPKIVDTQETLLERRGEAIEKAELMRRVRPDCVVEEAGLSRNISIPRKTVDDNEGACMKTFQTRIPVCGDQAGGRRRTSKAGQPPDGGGRGAGVALSPVTAVLGIPTTVMTRVLGCRSSSREWPRPLATAPASP